MGAVYSDDGSVLRLFGSTHAYAARKAIGAEQWPAWIEAQLRNPRESVLPGLRTLGEAAAVGDVTVRVDASTNIARSRSCMAGAFLTSDAEVWITADDDNFAAADELARAVRAVRVTRGVVGIPCWLRQQKQHLSFHSSTEPAPVSLGDSEGTFELLGAPDLLLGFGVVVLHREAVERVAAASESFRDEDGQRTYRACFLETVHESRWLGEDFAFCHRARAAGVSLHLLPDAWCEHDMLGCRITWKDGKLHVYRVDLSGAEAASSGR